MDLEKYKHVIKDAIQAEIEAQHFYEDIALRIKDDYLKKLFRSFAQEETKHEKILTAILKKETFTTSHFKSDTDFHIAETIEMPQVNDSMDLKDAIGIAMKNEEYAMNNYNTLAENCNDLQLKTVFLDLASMERTHKNQMEQSFVNIAYPEVW